MGSSKEDQEESVLAPLTEIKRLSRALPSRIMEYGISHPAQDSRNENGREICWQPCSRIIHSPMQRVPRFFSDRYIFFFSLKSPSFCSASLILSSVFTLLLVSILHHPERHTFSISPAVKCEESEQILQCLHANISPLECWKINKQPSIQGQRDTSTKERKQRGV